MIDPMLDAIDAHLDDALDEIEPIRLVGDRFIGTCASCKREEQLVECTSVTTGGETTYVNWCVDYFSCCDITTEKDYLEGKEVY